MALYDDPTCFDLGALIADEKRRGMYDVIIFLVTFVVRRA